MKKLLVIVIACFVSLNTFAQLEVKQGSFHEVVGFVNIDLDKQTDANDNPYAVIKIITENINDDQRHQLIFKSDPQTTIECDYRVGEVWVYISYHAVYMKISHPELGSTVFYLPFDMIGKKGYEMTLVYKEKKKYDGWGSLAIKTKPEIDADIYVNGNLIKQKTPYSNSMMPAGKYNIAVSKYGYIDANRTIELTNGANIDLEFEMREGTVITLTADKNTEVYIDGNYMSRGTWCGAMDSGSHQIIYKKSGYKETINNIIVEESVEKSYNFKLEPILGEEISINSEPAGATVYIDGKKYGLTPLVLNNINIGPHELTIMKEGKKPLKKDFVLKDYKLSFDEVLDNNPDWFINGSFSVSDSTKVCFSPGNLQYKASTNTWRFAGHQWDLMLESNKHKSSDYDGWIDLFPWGTSGYNGLQPYKTDLSDADYAEGASDISGTNYDWGVYNIISDATDYNWRTMTMDEWLYLLNRRETTSGIKYAIVQINGNYGLVLLPDNWVASNYDLGNNPNISISDWKNKCEANGAVFLPWMPGKYCPGLVEGGYYWTGSCYKNNGAIEMIFRAFQLDNRPYLEVTGRKECCAVRLVCPAE